MSLRGPVTTSTQRGRRPSLMGRMGGTGWTGGRSRKVSFKFLHTLWVYRLCIYLLVYEMKKIKGPFWLPSVQPVKPVPPVQPVQPVQPHQIKHFQSFKNLRNPIGF